MRVTFRTVHDGVAAVNDASERFARAQEQVETGKRIHAPSDDPIAMRKVIEGRTEIAALDSYTRTGDSAAARLAAIDTTLGAMVDKLTAAGVAASGARGSAVTQNTRVAIASTLTGLRDALVADLNTMFQGTALFSGAESQTPAYAMVAGAWTYQGDQTTVSVEVSDGRSVTIGLDGESIAKGADASDLFTEFDALIAAVQSGDDAGMGAGMDAIDRAFQRTIRAHSLVGADQKSVDDEQARVSDLRIASLRRVSKSEDVNLAQAITEMSEAQTAFEAALQAVGSASRVSLLDYLR
ncbi:MAG TPA: flagellin [Vicinamibacterales bacterium]|nr:flagellin [Vicinamibacterales bacterium]